MKSSSLVSNFQPEKVSKEVQLFCEPIFSIKEEAIKITVTNPFQWDIEEITVQLVQLLPNQPRKVLGKQIVDIHFNKSEYQLSLPLQYPTDKFASIRQKIENLIDDSAATYILSVQIDSPKYNLQLMKEIFRMD